MSGKHPYSEVREEAVKFLYKCDVERVHYFSNLLYDNHSSDFSFSRETREATRQLVEGIMDDVHDLDKIIVKASKNWSMDRMGSTDRSILRLATFELGRKKAPRKVIINEAIELAKKYGSAHSGSFVNGVLDSLSPESVAVH